jgi:7-cyano-7-deazaguanine synthase
MNHKPKAVVLLSGGMDSCVTAAIAREQFELALLHISYGQRTVERELEAFQAIGGFYGVHERLVVELGHFAQIGGSALTDPRIAMPVGQTFQPVRSSPASEAGQPGKAVPRPVPPTYVPFRNAHFLSVAVSWAEVLGAQAVFIGAVAEDSPGYPDCRPEFYRAFEEAIRLGTKPETQIRIETPVVHMRKSEIVRRGIALGAPLHLTWSCYQFEDEACGDCESCKLRLRAFTEAGVPDPIAYRPHVMM